jgi:SAM-dependent methyltransferase
MIEKIIDSLVEDVVGRARLEFSLEKIKESLVDDLLQRVRAEFTVMPRFGFHQPLDYLLVTLPPNFDEPLKDQPSGLFVPAPGDRFGYSPDDTDAYLAWGRYDHDRLIELLDNYSANRDGLSILDFGCSSGRVLRHFQAEHDAKRWNLYGCDIQARAIQWIRQYLPKYFIAVNTSTLPHLPFADSTFDFVYGVSVFTHIKFQWDAWLLELRRVMKPGAIMMQTIHAETAWTFYHEHRNEAWVQSGFPPRVYDSPEMDLEFLYHGDASVSQVFWKREVAREYWGRYFEILELRQPPEKSFQDWLVCRK